MAAQTLSQVPWADGTTVGVYPAVSVPAGSDTPSGTAVASAVVAGGAVSFTGLTAQVRYYAYAGGRGVRFLIPVTSASGDRARIEALETELDMDAVESRLDTTETGIATIVGSTNGSDDTSHLQALLNQRGYVKGKPGTTYKISSALTIKSFTTLDLTDCDIELAAGVGGNMLVNEALTAARTVIDGAITAADATLTSATAAFTAADVGKAVYVVGADASGRRRLETTILSFTNSTTVELAVNAGTTVANAWVTIGTRDRNISLIGGIFDRGANGTGGGSGYMANSVRLRRCDHLTVDRVQGESTAGKYMLNPGDVWDFHISRVHAIDVFSDVVHVNGPARHGTIRDTSADHAGDDVVSLTAGDFETFATMADTWGDIEDVLIDGVQAAHGEQRGVLVAAGTKAPAGVNRALNETQIAVRNVAGRFEGGGVWVGGDPQDASLRGGTYTTVTVDGVKVRGNTVNYNADVYLFEGTYDDITIKDVTGDPKGLSAVRIGDPSYAPTVSRLSIADLRWNEGQSANAAVKLERGTIDHLSIAKVRAVSTLTGGSIVRLTHAASTINRLALSDVYFEEAAGGSVSAVVQATDAAQVVGQVMLQSIFTKNVDHPLGRYAGTGVVIKGGGIRAEGAASWINLSSATATCTLELGPNTESSSDTLSLTAGAALRSKAGLRSDCLTAGITKAAGDQMFNTNAARACGVGPVVSDGTNWKGIFNGTLA